jgi:hypothetical protein
MVGYLPRKILSKNSRFASYPGSHSFFRGIFDDMRQTRGSAFFVCISGWNKGVSGGRGAEVLRAVTARPSRTRVVVVAVHGFAGVAEFQ